MAAGAGCAHYRVMDQKWLVGAGLFVVGLIFQAGILFAAFRALGRDVNGIGRKVGMEARASALRVQAHVVILLLEGIPQAQRAEYLAKAQLLIDAGK